MPASVVENSKLFHQFKVMSDGLESTTDAGEDPNQNKCDNDQDSAVKVYISTTSPHNIN